MKCIFLELSESDFSYFVEFTLSNWRIDFLFAKWGNFKLFKPNLFGSANYWWDSLLTWLIFFISFIKKQQLRSHLFFYIKTSVYWISWKICLAKRRTAIKDNNIWVWTERISGHYTFHLLIQNRNKVCSSFFRDEKRPMCKFVYEVFAFSIQKHLVYFS